MVKTKTAPEVCPVCGEDVPRGARACPGCGADERTGWNEEATPYDGLDLPDEAFEDPHSDSGRKTRPGGSALWPVVAIVVLAVIIIAFVFR